MYMEGEVINNDLLHPERNALYVRFTFDEVEYMLNKGVNVFVVEKEIEELPGEKYVMWKYIRPLSEETMTIRNLNEDSKIFTNYVEKYSEYFI